MKSVVVGSGIGGLTAAIRLAAAGHHVVVLERNPLLGGKVTDLEEAGYRFDTGPNKVTLPQEFDQVLALAGTRLADEVDLVRLDPQVTYRWPNGSTLEMADDPATTVSSVERLSPGSGEPWRRFSEHAATIWDAAERTILSGPPASRGGWLDLHPVVSTPAARCRRRRRRSSTTPASSSWSTTTPPTPDRRRTSRRRRRPASSTSSSRSAVGTSRAGSAACRDALVRAATSMGVDIRTGVDVGRIATDGGVVTGVELADGGGEGAEIVVSDVDAAHLYVDLLPSPKQARQLDKVGPSTSAFVVCAGVRGRTEGIAHHNVFFPLHDRQEFKFLEAGQMPIDQTIHASVSAVTDSGQAPPDCENWHIVVQTPPAIGIDRKLMTAAVLNRIAERGFDLRNRVEFTRTLLPADFDARYRAPGGAIHGTSSNGKKGVFSRPSNVGPVHGLYLVGGSAHPGSGLPFVAMSARIAVDLVAERHG